VKLERRWDMTHPQLALVHTVEVVPPPIPFSHLLADHQAILQGYLDTHITHNHSDRTIESERINADVILRRLRLGTNAF
jgi:hypothetical protein